MTEAGAHARCGAGPAYGYVLAVGLSRSGTTFL